MEVTIVDGVVVLIVAVSAFLAYARGLTREVLAIGGWILAAFAAFYFAPLVDPLIREAPVVGEFLRPSCTLSVLAAFALVFAAALLLLSIFTPLLSGVVQDSALGVLDRALGFLFGVVRGVVLVTVVYLLYSALVPRDQRIEMIDRSQTKVVVTDAADILKTHAPDRVPGWLDTRIERLTDCGPADAAALNGRRAVRARG